MASARLIRFYFGELCSTIPALDADTLSTSVGGLLLERDLPTELKAKSLSTWFVA